MTTCSKWLVHRVAQFWSDYKEHTLALQRGKGAFLDFLAGPVVKNSPANAGGVASIPRLGGFHTLQGNSAHVP